MELDFVGSDDAEGTRLAVDHLRRARSPPHRHDLRLRPDLDRARAASRLSRGAGAARHRRSIADLLFAGYGTREVGLQGIQAVLALRDPPTGAICFNDLAAFGAMLGLRHLGREAGRDFSIVGCDDVQEAAQWYPALTTIHNRQDEMGRLAAEMLAARIADPDAPVKRVMLEPRLVVRKSTLPPVS